MAESWVIARIEKQGADHKAIAREVIRKPEAVAALVKGMSVQSARIRYGSEKVVRFVSEMKPDLVYPFFDSLVSFLDCENKFLKWGAIITLANLASVDSKKKMEKIFTRYYAPITGPVMVTAANIIRGSEKIGRAKPELIPRVVKEILKVERAHFELHGEPSPECLNVACGHALTVLEALYPMMGNRRAVKEFIARQRGNPRASVRKKAEMLSNSLF